VVFVCTCYLSLNESTRCSFRYKSYIVGKLLLHNTLTFLHHIALDLSSDWLLRKMEISFFLGTKIRTAAEQTYVCLEAKRLWKPGQFHLKLDLHFLCHAQPLAELGRPQ